jgi:hypothetical protein
MWCGTLDLLGAVIDPERIKIARKTVELGSELINRRGLMAPSRFKAA